MVRPRIVDGAEQTSVAIGKASGLPAPRARAGRHRAAEPKVSIAYLRKQQSKAIIPRMIDTEAVDPAVLDADSARHPVGDRWSRLQLQAQICKVLTDPKRLLLIALLAEGPRSVGGLAEAAGLTLANTSQHLAVLRRAGLVETERHGTTIRYRLVGAELVEACRLVEQFVVRRLGRRGSGAVPEGGPPVSRGDRQTLRSETDLLGSPTQGAVSAGAAGAGRSHPLRASGREPAQLRDGGR